MDTNKLQWCGHISKSPDLLKAQGTVKGGRKTKEQVRGQNQGMDQYGTRQVLEGSGERGQMEKTDCKAICGVQRPLLLRD